MKDDREDESNIIEIAESIIADDNGIESDNNDVKNDDFKQLYSVTAEDLGSAIEVFQYFIINGMYSVSDQFSFDRDIKLEDVIAMTSTNRSNVSFVDIYTSSPDIIVADSADMKDIDDFITFCGDPYRKIQWDIRKGHNSASDCYYNVVVEDSNIDGEYKYYDGESEYIYIKLGFNSDKFVDESWVFEMVQSASNPEKWLINDCWETTYDEYNFASYKLHNADDPEEASVPDWFTMYKNFAGDTKVAFIGEDSNGTPYMMKESDGLYLYDGDSVNKVEIKGISLDSSAEYGSARYNCWINQLEFYIHAQGQSYNCVMDLSTGRVLYSVESDGVKKGYFDGDENEISESAFLREYYLFKGYAPMSDDPLYGADAMQEYLNSVYGAKEADNKDVSFSPVVLAFSSYLSDYGLRSRTKDAKNLDITGSDPVWVSEYRNLSDGIWERVALVGEDSNGVPYLVYDDMGITLYIYKEDAGVVELFNEEDALTMWYIPDINKALISYTHDVNVESDNIIHEEKHTGYYLYDLYTFNMEMLLDKCDMYDKFSINDSVVTSDEWEQTYSEVCSDFLVENRNKYDVESCKTLDSAYKAWLLDKNQ